MERQELIDLLDGLKWHQAGKWCLVNLVNIELAPYVKFNIKHQCYAPRLEAERREFIERWNIAFELHGNTSGVVLESPDQVKIYMLSQYDKLPKYLTLIGKRKRLAERIAPLQKKWFKYADELLELAKSL